MFLKYNKQFLSTNRVLVICQLPIWLYCSSNFIKQLQSSKIQQEKLSKTLRVQRNSGLISLRIIKITKM